MVSNTEMESSISPELDERLGSSSCNDAARVSLESHGSAGTDLVTSNADSVVKFENGCSVFVTPHERNVGFERVSTYIAEQEINGSDGTWSEYICL